jgi:hypothetical protein
MLIATSTAAIAICHYQRAMRMLALLPVALFPTVAHADGERGPSIGGALIATRAPDTELAGVQLELAWWQGPLGIAVETSHQEGLDARLTKVGGSLRLLLHHELTPSLLEPNHDVELGIELHGIVERAWWDDDRAHDPTSYGAGVVLRLRGDTDFTNIMAESRLFVRALWSRGDEMNSIARSTMAPAERGVLIVIGLGATFGAGDPGYARQFRPRLFDSSMLPSN